MPDGADVIIYRRGAQDTSDPSALKRHLEQIRYGLKEWIAVPGFGHWGRGGPEPDQKINEQIDDRACIKERNVPNDDEELSDRDVK
mmetsp:Transcript_33881/g.52847  ORF Transcript_33881/g.52847 Transcript_33881/m.52847 type:complete len:86 (+) Transcript_33881:25-282(+)